MILGKAGRGGARVQKRSMYKKHGGKRLIELLGKGGDNEVEIVARGQPQRTIWGMLRPLNLIYDLNSICS